MTLAPLVFGPNEVPRIDEETARDNLELALLSIIVHGDDDASLVAARGAVTALVELGGGQTDYLYVIMNALKPALREALRTWMMGKDETDDELIAKWRPLLGEMATLLEARGKAEGKAEGESSALIRVLAARGLDLTETQRERILACRDLATLDRWLERAVTAITVDDVLR